MKHVMKKTMVVLLTAATLVACNKKNNDNGSVSAGRDVRATAGPSNLPSGQGNLSGKQGAYIVVADQYQAQFDEAVKILVSTTVKPETVGTVNTRNGIEVRGEVAVNPSTGAVVSTSRIQLVITDSNVAAQQVDPILVLVGGATGSAVNYNANLTFNDQYGTITVTGTYDANNFRGTVRFANSRGAGYNGKTSGTLGDFVIPTCAFFVCQ